MMRDVDLDRILATWLAEGGERAPRRYVDAALDEIATTRQRPAWLCLAERWPVDQAARTRFLLVAALLAVLAIGVAIGIGSRLLEPPTTPVPPVPPAVVEPPPALPAMIPQAIEDWPVALSIPEGWIEIEGPCCDYRQFSGMAPEGHLSVGHESPYWTAVCSPECTDIEVPQTIPYDADKQLTALKAAVAAVAGSDAWEDLPPDVLPDITDGVRLDTLGPAADGRDWRRIHIVGLKARNLVTVTFSQPAEVFDEALLDAILADTTLLEAPVYSDGDLIPASGNDSYAMSIPGSWWTVSQPEIDGFPASGVRRYGDGEVLVSVGSADGVFSWCDETCRAHDGVSDLDAVEAAVRDGATYGPSTETKFGGEPARGMSATDGEREQRVVVAMHDGAPVAIRIDTNGWGVEPAAIDDILASFAFRDPARAGSVETVALPEAGLEIDLPAAWTASEGASVRASVGDETGTIRTCAESEADWEVCQVVTVDDLEDLARSVIPTGPGPGSYVGDKSVDRTTLGGEPAYVIRINGYEPEANGGQEIAYLALFHDGRPYLVRIRTTDDALLTRGVPIEDLRFTD